MTIPPFAKSLITILFFQALFLQASQVWAQQAPKMDLNVEQQNKFVYESELFERDGLHFKMETEVEVKALEEGQLLLSKRPTKMDIIHKHSQIFSLKGHFEPQDYLEPLHRMVSNSRFYSTLSPQGDILDQNSISSLHDTDKDAEDVQELYLYLLLHHNHLPALHYLGQEQSIGHQFEKKVELGYPAGNHSPHEIIKTINYTLSAINDSQTVFTYQAEMPLPLYAGGPAQIFSDGALFVDNVSGMPVYAFEVIRFKDYILVEYKQKGYECRKVQEYFAFDIYNGASALPAQSVADYNIEKFFDNYPDLEYANDVLEQMDLGEHCVKFEEESSLASVILAFAPDHDNQRFWLYLLDAECTYTNGVHTPLSGNWKNLLDFDIQTQNRGISIYTGANPIDEITAEVELLAMYGKKAYSLLPEHQGTLVKHNSYNWYLHEWQSNKVVIGTNTFVRLYNHEGQHLSKVALRYCFPQFEYVSQKLQKPINEVTPAQAFIYGNLTGPFSDQSIFLEMETEEDIGSIELWVPEGTATQKRKLRLKPGPMQL